MNSEKNLIFLSSYRNHVFGCNTQRPPSIPTAVAPPPAQGLWDRMGEAIEGQGLNDVGFATAGRLGSCTSGPLLVVYSGAVWYRASTPEDVDEIVNSHLKQGKRVDRFVMVLKRS
ncbi:ferredoxin [Bradyrhizobium sp. CCBAU 51745]|nr:ferredoxin [Bradyrhizobium sp. CCBAU 51745]